MVRMSTINGCLEREGLARLTISILVITTAGCLAYTWGYAEGVHNARTVILPSHAAAAPVILHATELTLAGPAVFDGLKNNSNSSTAAVTHAKRRHTRRRARKDLPMDGPVVPAEPLPAGQGASPDTAVPASASSTADTAAGSTPAAENSTGHARALLSHSRGLRHEVAGYLQQQLQR